MFAAIQYLKERQLPPHPQLMAKTFGGDAAAVADRYPLDRYGGSVGLAYSAAVTDSVFACPADRIASGLARTGPVYAYEFNDRTAPAPTRCVRRRSRWGQPLAGVAVSVRRRRRSAAGPGATCVVRPDGGLLEPVREDRLSRGDGVAAVAGVRRRRSHRQATVAADRRVDGHHRLQCAAPVPVLDEPQQGALAAPARVGHHSQRVGDIGRQWPAPVSAIPYPLLKGEIGCCKDSWTSSPGRQSSVGSASIRAATSWIICSRSAVDSRVARSSNSGAVRIAARQFSRSTSSKDPTRLTIAAASATSGLRRADDAPTAMRWQRSRAVRPRAADPPWSPRGGRTFAVTPTLRRRCPRW